MPLPGPPAEKEPPPPIIMFSTAKGRKSPSCGRRMAELSLGGARAGVTRSRTPRPSRPGLTKKEQLSRPIMMCVSSGNGVGPRLTLDMSLSSWNQEEWMRTLSERPPGLARFSGQVVYKRVYRNRTPKSGNPLERREPAEPRAQVELSSNRNAG